MKNRDRGSEGVSCIRNGRAVSVEHIFKIFSKQACIYHTTMSGTMGHKSGISQLCGNWPDAAIRPKCLCLYEKIKWKKIQMTCIVGKYNLYMTFSPFIGRRAAFWPKNCTTTHSFFKINFNYLNRFLS